MRLELEVPRHIHGVKAAPVEVPAGSDAGALRIEFAENHGPLNMSVRIIARCTGSDAAPHVAATDIELVTK